MCETFLHLEFGKSRRGIGARFEVACGLSISGFQIPFLPNVVVAAIV